MAKGFIMKSHMSIGVLMILCQMPHMLSAQSLFFSATDQASSSQGIFRADADGSHVSLLLTNTFNSFAVDAITSKVYFSTYDPSHAPGISRASFDGSNPELLVSNWGYLNGMEFDERHNRLFVGCGFYAYVMNPDNPHMTQFNVGLNTVMDVECDPIHDRVFLANANSFSTGCNLHAYPKGGGLGTQIIGSLWNLKGIGIDPVHEDIYYAASKPNYSIPSIYKAKMDGSEPQMFVDTTQLGYSTPWDIEVVPELNAVYWADETLGGIWRANLDGTNPKKIVNASGVRYLKVTVPEPSTLALLLTASFGGLLWWRRRSSSC
jgi:hypothetical protein